MEGERTLLILGLNAFLDMVCVCLISTMSLTHGAKTFYTIKSLLPVITCLIFKIINLTLYEPIDIFQVTRQCKKLSTM